MSDLPPIRYLAAADVAAAMPDLEERLRLAEVTLRGLAGRGELPPKIGVHPREPSSFAHAMPAFLPGDAEDGSADRLGMKWVLGFQENPGRGLPAIHGLVLLNDARSGIPTAILDAGPITAERTSAISGVAIRSYAPRVSGRAPRAAIIGAGVQGHAHVQVVGHLLPGVELRVFDRDPGRAAALAERASATPGIASATVTHTARETVAEADVVITVASFVPPPERQVMGNAWLAPDALVVPVDYATYCAAEVARDAGLFLVDHLGQFLVNRDAGNFDDYPDPAAMLGEALAAGTPRPDGRVVVTHLGTGLADVVFATAILATADRLGLGTALPR